jgi:hypothetical protein
MPPENYLVEYQIGVYRIEVPSSIAPTDTLVAALYGVIGPDGSYGFDHMEFVKTDFLFDMTAFGIHNQTPGLAWPQMIVQWRGAEFVKLPPHADSVRVVFHQPDGSIVEEVVSVNP